MFMINMAYRVFTVVKFPLVAVLGASAGYTYTRYKPVCVVWDLDRTLIESVQVRTETSGDIPPLSENLPPPDFVVNFSKKYKYYGYTRQWVYPVVKFFSVIGIKQYIYTASTSSYATSIIKDIGIEHMIIQTFTRKDVPVNRESIKDILRKDITAYASHIHNETKSNNIYMTEIGKKFIEYSRAKFNDTDPDLFCAFLLSQIDDFVSNDWAMKKFASSAQISILGSFGKDMQLIPEMKKDRTILVDDNVDYHIPNKETGIVIQEYCALDDKYNRVYDHQLLGVAWIIFRSLFTDNVADVINESRYAVNKHK